MKFSKNLHNITDNNQSSSSFRKYHKRSKKTKNKKEENSSSFYYSINNSNNQLLNESKEKSGENKSLSEKKENINKLELETPKKKSDKNKMFEENLKNKKKDLLNIDNIHGKNLMQRFEEMSEKIVFEEKNKNRVSSVEKEIKSYSNTKNNIIINTNKSWNKKKYGFPLSKNPIKIINKDKINQGINFPIKKKTKIMTRYNTSNIKELQNLLNKNKYNIDLKSLIDKYRPKKINKKEIKNNTFLIDKNNTDNKGRFKKLRKTPNSDSHNRKLSFSLKIRDTLTKNLMQDYYKKNTEMINVNKYINTNERKPKDIF